MSVLIKGIKMPKDGNYIFSFASDENGQNTLFLMIEYASFKLIGHGGVADEIPPHGRLIDADALNAEIKGPSRPEIYDGMEEVWWIEKCLANAPTIIEAEVEE